MVREIPVLPVYGERALKLGKTLVIADLHIGIEHELERQGAVIPSQTGVMEDSIISLIEKTCAQRLAILGDVKHNIPSISIQEYREIPRLIESLGKKIEVVVVKGNHDGNLEKLLPDVSILDHLEIEGALLAHGHSWIKAESIDAEVVVLAHSHPAIAFVDDFARTVKEPAWIKGRFKETLKEHYNVKRLPGYIVIPAYNPLLSGAAFNQPSEKKLLGPYFTSGVIDLCMARAYLLDGTDLGPFNTLKAAQKETY